LSYKGLLIYITYMSEKKRFELSSAFAQRLANASPYQ
jgi:hypothetical protein